ncbi:uncharacterized protein METZ01_LOCUS205963, partial [marine metagenome]
ISVRITQSGISGPICHVPEQSASDSNLPILPKNCVAGSGPCYAIVLGHITDYSLALFG